MTDAALDVLRRHRPGQGQGPVPTVAHGLAARRQRPQRAVQLGVRPSLRRHPGAAHRGHRPRPQHPRGLRLGDRLAALARSRLGRGPGGRRPLRPLPAVRAVRHVRRGGASRCTRPARPTTATARRRRSTSAAKPPDAETRPAGTTATAATSPRTTCRFEADGRHPCCDSGCRTPRSSSTTSCGAR